LVAEKWSYVKLQFGHELQLRLLGHLTSLTLDEALAPVADRYPEVRKDLLDMLEADQSLGQKPAMLQLFSNIYPGSEVLKAQCLRTIRSDDGTWGGYEKAKVAVDILASQFEGDQHLLNELLSQVREKGVPRSAAVSAVCAGWPDCPAIDEWYAEIQRQNRNQMAPSEYFSIFYARIPSDKFVPAFWKDLQWVHADRMLMRTLSDPVLSRAKRDVGVRDALLAGVRKEASPHAKASFPRILAECGDFREELLSRVRTELAAQLDRKQSPEVGFDFTYGDFRSVALSLLDVLRG